MTIVICVGPQRGASAAPAPILAAGAPSIPTHSTTGAQSKKEGASVDDKTGTFSYSVPIAVPPGRLGMQPSIALSYSSEGTIRGTVAHGWSLPVATIDVDIKGGLLGTPSYRAGGRALFAVQEPDADPGAETYRADNDGSFARYEFYPNEYRPEESYWLVRTLDGRVSEYRDPASRIYKVSDPGRWYLTSVTDRFGNMVEYQYHTKLTKLGHGSANLFARSVQVAEIHYSANKRLGIQAHARIVFEYEEEPSCRDAAGSPIPTGAALTFRRGVAELMGERRLTAIRVDVRKGKSFGERIRYDLWYDSAALGYDAGGVQSKPGGPPSCERLVSPRRQLVQVTSRGTNADGTVVNTEAPTLSFAYHSATPHYAPVNDPPAGLPSILAAGERNHRGNRGGRHFPTDHKMMDVDGDGRQDLLATEAEADGFVLSSQGGQRCWMSWKRNEEDGFSTVRKGFRSHFSYAPVPGFQGEPLGLESYGLSMASESSDATSTNNAIFCSIDGASGKGHFYFRHIDLNGDGRLDLAASLERTIRFHGRNIKLKDLPDEYFTPELGGHYPANRPEGGLCYAGNGYGFQRCVVSGGMINPNAHGFTGTGTANLDQKPWVVPTFPGQIDRWDPDDGFDCLDIWGCDVCPGETRPKEGEGDDDAPAPQVPSPLFGCFGPEDYNWGDYGQGGIAVAADGGLCSTSGCEAADTDYGTEMVHDRHVWRVWWNNGTPTPWSGDAQLVLSPVPLETTYKTSPVEQPGSAWHRVTDIDGDGCADAVWQHPEQYRRNTQKWDFRVWKGDCSGNFEGNPEDDGNPYHWSVPNLPVHDSRVGARLNTVLLSTRRNGVDERGDNFPRMRRYSSKLVGLVDVNGDGLKDLVESRFQENEEALNDTRVYFNTGRGFASQYVLWGEQLPFLTRQVTVPLRDDHGNMPPSDPAYSVTTQRVVDVDGDGLLDVVAMEEPDEQAWPPFVYDEDGSKDPNPHTTGRWCPGCVEGAEVTVYRNNGTRLVPMPSSYFDADFRNAMANITSLYREDWKQHTGVLDFNGDGLTDLVTASQAGSEPNAPGIFCDSPHTEVDSCTQPAYLQATHKAPGLLRAVDNGRGAILSVEYAASNDSDVVAVRPHLGERIRPRWVVASTATDPGDNQPALETSYYYEGPLMGQDPYVPGELSFVGFKSAEKTSAGGAVTRQEYDYDQYWRGLPVRKLVYGSNHPQDKLVSIEQSSWAQERLAPELGALPFYFLQEHFTWTCSHGDTEESCEVPSKRSGTLVDMAGMGTPVRAFQKRHRYATDGDSFDSPGSLLTTTWAQLISGEEDYRVEQQGSARYTRTAGSSPYWNRIGREGIPEYHPKDVRRLAPIRTRSYISDTEALTSYVKYKGGADDTEGIDGNPALGSGVIETTVKPQQFKDEGEDAAGTTVTYDAFDMYPVGLRNEHGHTQKVSYDLATGQLLSAEGPNGEKTVHRYDGLGRMIETWQRIEPDAQPIPMSKADYTHGPRNNTVTTRSRLPGPIERFTASRTKTDGLGRTLSNIEFNTPVSWDQEAPLRSSEDTQVRRTYNASGHLAKVEAPDPSAGSSAAASLVPEHPMVELRYDYDALGRILSATLPGCSSTQCGRIEMSYDGRVTTVSEVAYPTREGEPLASKRLTENGYGELVKLEELIDRRGRKVSLTIEPQELFAVTHYSYDGAGNVRRIEDADGVVTEMTHDFLGRRLSITRGGKTRAFGYDDNGNLLFEIAPHSDPAGVLEHTTSMVYDDLDRLVEKEAGQRFIAARDRADFAVGATRWCYDGNCDAAPEPGYIGRLKSVHTPTESRTYEYDTRGLPTAVDYALDLRGPLGNPAMHFVRRQTMDYDPSGALDWTLLPTESPLWTRYLYDSRGRESSVQLPDLWWEADLARLERNYSGHVTRRVSSVFDQDQVRGFDRLGRVITDEVRSGGIPRWQETNHYFAFGDVRYQTVYGFGISNIYNFDYRYDARHQLVGAEVPGNGFAPEAQYAMSATYSHGGRLETATQDAGYAVNGTELFERDVSYHYGCDDPPATTTPPIFVPWNSFGGLNSSPSNGSSQLLLAPSLIEQEVCDPEELVALYDQQDPASGPIVSYEYDEAGNVTGKTQGQGWTATHRTYEYDGEDQLRRATSGSTQELYFYGPDRERWVVVYKQGAKVEQVRWSLGAVEAVFDGAGDPIPGEQIANIHLGGARVARVYDGEDVELTYSNRLGHQVISQDASLADLSGEVFVYSPFGEVLEQAGDSQFADIRRRFNGKEWSAAAGLSYYGWRYYDPVSMRWTQRDPLFEAVPDAGWAEPRRQNLYTFSLNNPMRFVDPDGLNGIPAEGQIIDMDGDTRTVEYPDGTLDVITINPDGSETTVRSAPVVIEGSGDRARARVRTDAILAGGMQIIETAVAIAYEAIGWTPLGIVQTGVEIGLVATGLEEFEVDLLERPGGAAVPGQRGKGCPRCPCFVPGTLVLMADGTTKPIEEVEVDDWVLAVDPQGEEEARAFRVAGTMENFTERVVRVEISAGGDAEVIETTVDHPFWTETEGWVAASLLEPGDLLRSADDSLIEIVSVSIESRDSPTHNLTVDGVHTYFVLATDTSVLVHNQNGPKIDGGGFFAARHEYGRGSGSGRVRIPLQGTRSRDFTLANKEAGFSKTPEGYTWHHANYNPRTGHGDMQLVRKDVHGSKGHAGGVSEFQKSTGIKYDTRKAVKHVKKKGRLRGRSCWLDLDTLPGIRYRSRQGEWRRLGRLGLLTPEYTGRWRPKTAGATEPDSELAPGMELATKRRRAAGWLQVAASDAEPLGYLVLSGGATRRVQDRVLRQHVPRDGGGPFIDGVVGEQVVSRA